MNTDTGHLVDLEKMPEFRGRPGYAAVPEHLREEAIRELRGLPETYVPKRGRSQLARYAAEQRRARRQMQKQSRRKNRGRS